MAFGKPGRPREDRPARQYEIYQAIVPLLERDGARRLSMQEAAGTAGLSIGGLYHYFPTKRDLVLHGLDLAAHDRLCQGFRGDLARVSRDHPEQLREAILDRALWMFAFIRPSARAALELGAPELQRVMDADWTHHVGELAASLHLLAPRARLIEREALGRAIRRLLLGWILAEQVNPAELRRHLRLLIDGELSRQLPAYSPHPAAVAATLSQF